ncbi:MAG TPA: endonuclease/exonuclease/phosphatase family protein [Verrucomicrobiae bacterium]|nr:endonuclease/exonuclease/phosphatase family protein [Verrucomicrobiae bacterium]
MATFNLNCRNPHTDQILDALKDTKADVLFLQETTVESERFLATQLNASYPYFYATGHLGRFAEEGLAFASKIPLREVTFSPPDKGFFGFYSATCRVGETTVKLINVHLTPFVIRQGAGIVGDLAEIQGTEDKHAAEIETIVRTFDVGQPVIVAGDFNSPSTFIAPSRLTKMGLVDSFAATHSDPNTHPTWHGTVASVDLRLRLDYIFHTRRFQSVESEIIEQGGSDHFPIVSELRLFEQEGAVNRKQLLSGETNSSPQAAGSGH